MQKFFFTVLLILVTCDWARAQSTLLQITKADSRDIIQIFLTFDTLPKYTNKISGKRVDLLLEDTKLVEKLSLFEPDSRIIKVLTTPDKDRSILSFFFRYLPQNVSLATSKDGKLVVEIVPGNQYSKSYQDLSQKLKGLAVLERKSPDYSNPLLSSPYATNWTNFFSEYEGKVAISAPFQFSTPPFPIIAMLPPGKEDNLQLLPPEVLELGKTNLLNNALPAILDRLQKTTNEEEQKLLALTYGEALLHAGEFEGSFKQLYLLAEKYPEEQVGVFAKYLLVRLQAEFHNPNLAEADFRLLESRITVNSPLAPYFRLSQIETALATGQIERAEELINKGDVGFGDVLERRLEIYQGDVLAAKGDTVQSYVSFQLLKDMDFIASNPFSLNNFCGILYNYRKFSEAADCYGKLLPLVTDKEQLGLIDYRQLMAAHHSAPDEGQIDSFARIADSYQETDGGYRAAIKETDLKYLENQGLAETVFGIYQNIAANAPNRETAAEAAFKAALIQAILHHEKQSIDLLMTFLREYQIGDLREHANALLLQILPKEIQQLIADKNYMEALVLSKQNRDLFQKQWLPADLLSDIANAFQEVGIYGEAQRVYLYLLDIADAADREKFFLPLIESAFKQGEYSRVDDFASQYFYNYPDGTHKNDILALRLEALIASGRYERAASFLPDPLPDHPSFPGISASLHFQANRYKEVVAALAGVEKTGGKMSETMQFMLAESLYQLQDYDAATPLFVNLVSSESFADQSLFRQAEIERHRGNSAGALKLFGQIVEKGKSPLWRKYAEKEIALAALLEKQ